MGASFFWRAFDTADHLIAPALEDALRTDVALDAISGLVRVRTRASAAVAPRAAQAWHLLGVPARTDVIALNKEAAQLDRDLRRLARRLDGG